jgi:tRNA A37 threonylcarbamoyltransferase TsaD
MNLRVTAMGLRVVAPSPRYCTDNAAMVAVAHHRVERGELGDLHLNALLSLPLP